MEKEKLKGRLALSKAGRDKGSIYVIWDEDGEYVYLVDGKYKPLEKPKKKKRKHIAVLRERAEELIQTVRENRRVTNEDIKRTIKSYRAVRNI